MWFNYEVCAKLAFYSKRAFREHHPGKVVVVECEG